MDSDFFIELVGYLASALILVSVTRTSILKLRLFGMAGAVTFVVYGVVIEAYPIALVNLVIIGVHVFFLRDLLSKKREYFTTLEVRPESRYLEYFIDFHREDIRRFRPDFVFEPRVDQIRVFVLRDLVPAGLLIGRPCVDGSLEVELDYVIPRYRDFRVAEYLFSERSGVFTDPGCSRVWSRSGSAEHDAYLERIGFIASDDFDGRAVFTKDLEWLGS